MSTAVVKLTIDEFLPMLKSKTKKISIWVPYDSGKVANGGFWLAIPNKVLYDQLVYSKKVKQVEITEADIIYVERMITG